MLFKITAHSDVTPFSLVYKYQRFGGAFYPHLQSTPKIETAGSSETLVSTGLQDVIYQGTALFQINCMCFSCYISQDGGIILMQEHEVKEDDSKVLRRIYLRKKK
jgi:hypothetical protein